MHLISKFSCRNVFFIYKCRYNCLRWEYVTPTPIFAFAFTLFIYKPSPCNYLSWLKIHVPKHFLPFSLIIHTLSQVFLLILVFLCFPEIMTRLSSFNWSFNLPFNFQSWLLTSATLTNHCYIWVLPRVHSPPLSAIFSYHGKLRSENINWKISEII